MYYITVGIHTRNSKNKTEIFMPGDKIEPTSFELVQFPNKFRQVADKVEVTDEVETKFEGNLNTGKLEELKVKLGTFIEANEYEEDVMKEAAKLSKRNPEKQHTVDALVEDIEKFFGELEEDEEEVKTEE